MAVLQMIQIVCVCCTPTRKEQIEYLTLLTGRAGAGWMVAGADSGSGDRDRVAGDGVRTRVKRDTVNDKR